VGITLHSTSETETRRAGERLGRILQGGEIVLLHGDLGVGKTQFTKGIARGLGIRDEIVSPTFTLVAQFEGRLPLAHYDLYRVESSRDLQEIGYLEEDDPRCVRVVEWGERAPRPPGAIVVTLELVGNTERRIHVEGRDVEPGMTE
jgi:tRNA threonylcarbamoyladenosine biosynthesis protein TsaE